METGTAQIAGLEDCAVEAGSVDVSERQVTGQKSCLVQPRECELRTGMAVRVGEVTVIEHRFTKVGVGETAPHKPAAGEPRILQDHRRQLGVHDRAVRQADVG